MAVYALLTNNGTLVANDGNLLVTEGLTNLSGSILTGGTYISSGFFPPGATSVADNILAFGFNTNADLAVDAATIILDGPASAIDGYTRAGIFRRHAGAAGASVADHRRGRGAGATGRAELCRDERATDAGVLTLGGGTLSAPGLAIGSGGTLAGYGFVSGPLTNDGAVIAAGGTLGSLDLLNPVSGGGSMTVAPGSTLVLSTGGSAGALNVGGLLFDTGTTGGERGGQRERHDRRGRRRRVGTGRRCDAVGVVRGQRRDRHTGSAGRVPTAR